VRKEKSLENIIESNGLLKKRRRVASIATSEKKTLGKTG